MTAVRLGLDIGTTSIKAAAYDSTGQIVAMVEKSAPDVTGREGKSEQDMNAVLSVALDALKSIASKINDFVPVSLGISAQGDGLWAVDETGKPVGPAMLWNDTRASADVEQLTTSGKAAAVGRACHTSLWPGTSGALWRWLKQNEPEIVSKIATIFTCGDWIGLNLTGQAGTDFSNASIPFIDFSTRTYSSDVADALDCSDIQQHLLEPQRATTPLGTLTAETARLTGLPEGLPVSTPTLDLTAMIVGMGMDQPGQTMMIMGTTAVVNILTDHIETHDQPVGASALHATSDVIIRILAPTTGASAFNWFTELHPLSLGGDTPGEVAAKLNELVTKVPVGANGVTFLPYLNGERAPFVSPNVTASFQGLTSRSTKADMGRAVLEGGAMSLRHCFEMEGGLPSEPVQLTGGGSKNPVWCQIISDVIGVPIVVSEASDQGLWGAACIGAAAAGLGDVMSLVKREEKVQRYEPNAEAHAAYCKIFKRYKLLSENARLLSKQLKQMKDEL
nr:FGGY family carbohydrate kinase [uncultured Cohaesibacter sp.]